MNLGPALPTAQWLSSGDGPRVPQSVTVDKVQAEHCVQKTSKLCMIGTSRLKRPRLWRESSSPGPGFPRDPPLGLCTGSGSARVWTCDLCPASERNKDQARLLPEATRWFTGALKGKLDLRQNAERLWRLLEFCQQMKQALF